MFSMSGTPSTMAPTDLPCDSPYVVTLKYCPKVDMVVNGRRGVLRDRAASLRLGKRICLYMYLSRQRLYAKTNVREVCVNEREEEAFVSW